ncbi:MAG: alpha/beta hydrolase [Gemmatimonadetes bacterium]|nr:alpha/beta hydrolase [Gemmatimonadota bacterium]
MTPPAAPVVVLGGFLSTPAVYRGMQRALAELAGAPVRVADGGTADWRAAVSERGWARILRELERTVDRAVALAGGGRVTLVGHSAGGVVGRLYLSPESFRGRAYRGLEKVERLITLGSPHLTVRGAPVRRRVDRTYPGAFFAPTVAYVAVGGRCIRGDARGSARERTAHFLYRHLCGDGAQWGDGLVPLASAPLEGARNLELDGVAHAPLGGARWYGSPDVVRQWFAPGRG